MKNRVFAFHLLNDRSGSPKVLSQIIKSWVKDGREVCLYTSLHQEGFLSNIQGIKYYNGWYKFKANPWIRLIYYSISQLILIFSMFSKIKSNDTIYINTVLPFGAAIIGKIKGCKVVYHVHESTVNPAILKWFLFKIISWSASEIINVSNYVQDAHGISKVNNHIVYNAIDDAFLSKVKLKQRKEPPSNILMICSLKAYKGVFEFVDLAIDHPQFSFKLVLNASQLEINSFFEKIKIPKNLTLFDAQKDLHPFFYWADLIVNLSRPDGWIETFGLTIIEGMSYGLPAIVPPIGGILEVIEEGKTGFNVDSRDKAKLNKTLKIVLNNPIKYQEYVNASLSRIQIFKEKTMLNEINKIVWN